MNITRISQLNSPGLNTQSQSDWLSWTAGLAPRNTDWVTQSPEKSTSGLVLSGHEWDALTWSWWSLLRSPALRGSCLPPYTGLVHIGRDTDGRSWCRDHHRSSSAAALTGRGDLTRAMRRLSVRPLPLSPSPGLRDTRGADCPSSSPGGHCDGYWVLPSRYWPLVLLPTWLVTGQLGGQTDPATVSPPPEPPPHFLRTSLLVWTEAVVRGGLQTLTRGTEPVTLTHTRLGFTRGLDWINIQVQEETLRDWRGAAKWTLPLLLSSRQAPWHFFLSAVFL